MLNSNYRQLCPIDFPAFAGRQKYMHSFRVEEPNMARGFEDYLAPVMRLLRAVGIKTGTVHVTVDEKVVAPGMSQRRPGPHVDGCFVPSLSSWNHGGGWLHHCNDVGVGEVRRMPVIVAASVAGCRAWRGEFDAQPKSDGDLSHISDRLVGGELLPPNVGYLLSADCVHESVVFDRPTQRSFLRVALPTDFRFDA